VGCEGSGAGYLSGSWTAGLGTGSVVGLATARVGLLGGHEVGSEVDCAKAQGQAIWWALWQIVCTYIF
jgi:hypothetical protein